MPQHLKRDAPKGGFPDEVHMSQISAKQPGRAVGAWLQGVVDTGEVPAQSAARLARRNAGGVSASRLKAGLMCHLLGRELRSLSGRGKFRSAYSLTTPRRGRGTKPKDGEDEARSGCPACRVQCVPERVGRDVQHLPAGGPEAARGSLGIQPE